MTARVLAMVRNRVLLVLVATGLAAGLELAFLTMAPNRLVSGHPISLTTVATGRAGLAFLPGIALLVGPFLPQRRLVHCIVAAAAAGLLVALPWVAGTRAEALAHGFAPAARISLGGGFWALLLGAALALADATHRLGLRPASRVLIAAAILGAIGLLGVSGALDQLGIAKEYADRRAVFAAAVLRHMLIVIAALAPTVALGVPLGIFAQRRRAVRAWLFPVLNLVQTIPSIALFGFMIAPLSALAALFPGLAALGVAGVGMAPAVIALVLYSLLPIVRNTTEGLDAVPSATVEAGRGLGMTQHQIFWRVEAPLAFPVLLSGFRIATVQAVGLAAVAALIGAGGLGAIMFQGLFADALDLVLLGAIPVILLALAADALLTLAGTRVRKLPA